MTPLSEAETEIPYLGAEEVVDEVITLLAKLERDRQDTLDTLHSERDRVSMLGGKIDSLAARRITELPLSVQKGKRCVMFYVLSHVAALIFLFCESFLCYYCNLLFQFGTSAYSQNRSMKK